MEPILHCAKDRYFRAHDAQRTALKWGALPIFGVIILALNTLSAIVFYLVS
jgi:hypothetical protein